MVYPIASNKYLYTHSTIAFVGRIKKIELIYLYTVLYAYKRQIFINICSLLLTYNVKQINIYKKTIFFFETVRDEANILILNI